MSDSIITVLFVCFCILALIGFVIFSPLATIWSLNTLFRPEIAYDFWTWCAAAWLMSVVGAYSMYSSKSKS